MLARHLNLLAVAAENVTRNSRGYFVAASALVAGLTLLLAAVAISGGIARQSASSIDAGADVYCGWDAFGRNAPMPVERVEALRSIDGVERVVPRIVGRVELGDELPVVIGVPLESLRSAAPSIEGSLPRAGDEVLIGRELANVLELRPGATIALEGQSIRLFRVSGCIDATSSLWSAKAVVCDLGEAMEVFGDRSHVTDACVFVRDGYEDSVAKRVQSLDPRYRVQTRELVASYAAIGTQMRGGVFAALAAVVLALAIPAFAVTTYAGVGPRRREIGLLKCEGWSTADVLEMVALENLLVSVAVVVLSLALALVWVRGLGAPWIGPLFLADLPAFPRMVVPSSFLPLAPALAFAFSVSVTMTGSIYTTWRTAITRPAEVLR